MDSVDQEGKEEDDEVVFVSSFTIPVHPDPALTVEGSALKADLGNLFVSQSFFTAEVLLQVLPGDAVPGSQSLFAVDGEKGLGQPVEDRKAGDAFEVVVLTRGGLGAGYAPGIGVDLDLGEGWSYLVVGQADEHSHEADPSDPETVVLETDDPAHEPGNTDHKTEDEDTNIFMGHGFLLLLSEVTAQGCGGEPAEGDQEADRGQPDDVIEAADQEDDAAQAHDGDLAVGHPVGG